MSGDFYVSELEFYFDRGGIYVGRWSGNEIERRGFINAHLGNPYKIDSGLKSRATIKLIESYIDRVPEAVRWMNRCYNIVHGIRKTEHRKIVCHCGGDPGCHAHLIARLWNSSDTWDLTLAQHHDILLEGSQLDLFAES